MPLSTVTVSTTKGPDPFAAGAAGGSIRSKVRKFRAILDSLIAGTRLEKATLRHGTARASGTLTLSTASGTVGGVINGVSVTVAASGGDTATAAAIAAAINASANALVNQHVEATSSAAVVTIRSKRQDASGNAITLAASGTGVTASSARLAGGTETVTTF